MQSLTTLFEVRYDPDLVDDRPRLLAALKDASALIVRNRTQVDGELLAAGPHLRVVGRLGVGLENIDQAACRSHGIAVCPAVGANARSVAEYVLCSAMMLLRGMYLQTAEVASGRWPRQVLANGRESFGRTLGVVGFGSVGRATAELAAAAGFRIVYWDRPAGARPATDGAMCAVDTLEALLAASDVVSLHVPLDASTRQLIDATRIEQMKPGAILVNAARGGVIDEFAVANALSSGRLGGAAIDVFETEPLPTGSPWEGCPNLLLTPHVAGLSMESNQRVAQVVAEAVMLKLTA